jgi:hypothetical protein
MDALNVLALAENRPEAFNNVSVFSEDTGANRVKVQLLVFNEEEITRFRNTVLDSPNLTFVKSSGPYQFTGCGTT